MKKFFETLKDVLYDFMDYAMMLVIIVVVIGVIGWRLDILFAEDDPNFQQKDIAEETVITEDEKDSDEDGADSDEDADSDKEEKRDSNGEETDSDDQSETSSDREDSNDNKDNSDKDKDQDKKSQASTITVHIPQGSSTQSIGNILEEKDLINSIEDFNKKVKSMNLEKHLRAGDYDIDTNSSLEKIVRVIANQS